MYGGKKRSTTPLLDVNDTNYEFFSLQENSTGNLHV